MRVETQEKALGLVAEWSKWLMSVNLVATAGCVSVLQSGVGGTSRLFLLLAIGTFSLSLLAAALLLGLIPGLAQRLPVGTQDDLQDRTQIGKASVYDGRLWGGLTVRTLAVTQFALFLLAAGAFLGWVLTKPAP